MDVEPAKISKASAATREIRIRSSQGMIKDIVNVSAQVGDHAFAKVKIFVQTEVHSPRSRSQQNIAFCYCGIGEHIRPDRWRSKSIRIEELIGDVSVIVADNQGTVSNVIAEVPHCFDRGNRD